MSTTIDQRIVELKFNNSDFESKAGASIKTLKNLNESLKLKEAASGIANVTKAIGGFTLSSVTTSVKECAERFSAMEIIGVTALANIANSAIETGKQMVESLTITPIKDGFDEYELKMGSVQTIMASTGADLDVVTQKLAELNTYSDKTIYSFADMTESIGKFTNNGVDLDTAVAAIQGISNEAALAGANAQQASHAMYNFSQALSSGYVQLIDWKSIENANMATVSFKEELIKTAAELGTLQETAEGTYEVLSSNNKGEMFDQAISATSHFNDSLQYQWMTSEVLTTTLAKYADETTELGKAAFAAAQDVKTFSQLMDTLKEAVGSGWATTWELVFGDFNEAKELWSSVNDVVGDFIARQSDARNAVVKEWKDLGGRAAILESIKNLYIGLGTVIKPVNEAFHEIIPPLTGAKLAELSTRFAEFTAKLKLSDEQAALVKSTFRGLFAIVNILGHAALSVVKAFAPLIGVLGTFASYLLHVTAPMGEFLVAYQGTAEAIIDSKIAAAAEVTARAFKKLAEAFQELAEKLAPHIEAVKEFMKAVYSGFTDSWSTFVITQYVEWTSWFVKEVALATGGALLEYAKNLLPIVGGMIVVTKQFFTDLREQGFVAAAGNFKNNLKPVVNDLITVTKNAFGQYADKIKEIYDSRFLAAGLDPKGFGYATIGAIKNLADGIKPYVQDTALYEAMGRFADRVHEFVTKLQNDLQIDISFGGLWGFIKGFYELTTWLIKGFVDGVIDVAPSAFNVIRDVFSKVIDVAKGVLGIHSPSTEFKTIGEFAVEGFKVGVTSAASAAWGAIKKFASICVDIVREFGPDLAGGMADFGKAVASHVGPALDVLGRAFQHIDLNTIKEVAKLFKDLAIAEYLHKSSKSLGEFNGVLSMLGDEESSPLAAVKDLLFGYQKDLKSDVLKNIAVSVLIFAAAIAVLAGSIIAVSGLTPEQVQTGAIAVGSMLTLISALELLLTKFGDFSAGTIVASSIAIALTIGSIKDLADVVIELSDIDPASLTAGLTAVSTLATVCIALSKFSTDSDSEGLSVSAGLGMMLFAQAIKMMAGAVVDMGEVNPQQLIIGLVGISALLLACAEFVKSTSESKFTAQGGLAFLGLAKALKMISDAVVIFGSMDIGTLLKGIGSVSLILLELGALTKYGEVDSLNLQTAIGMIGMAIALQKMAEAVEIFGSFDIHTLVQGLVAVGLLIGAMAGVMYASKGSVFDAGTGLGMIAMAYALKMLAEPLQIYGTMDLRTLAQGLVAIGLALAAFAVTTAAMSGSVAGAAALIVVVFALSLLADVMKKLGEMSVGEIIKSLVAIAGALVLLAGAAIVMAAAIPVMAGLGVALLALGAGVLFIGAGLMFLSIALVTIGGSVGVVVTALVTIMTAFIMLIPEIIVAAAKGLFYALDEITQEMPLLVEILSRVLDAILEVLNEYYQPIIELVLNILFDIIKGLGERAPILVEAIMDILQAILDGIKNHAEEVIKTVVDIIELVCKTLSDKIPELVQAAYDMVIAIINGIADTLFLPENAKKLREAIEHLLRNMVEAAKELLGIHSPSKVFAEMGEFVIKGLVKGLKDLATHPVKVVKEITKGIIGGIKDKYNDVKTKGTEFITNFKDGMDAIKNHPKESMDAIITLCSQVDTSKINTVGIDMVAGFINGMNSKLGDLKDAVSGFFGGAIDVAKEVLGIHSPSKEFASIADYALQGFKVGLLENQNMVYSAVSDVGNGTIDKFKETFRNLSAMIDDQIDASPTISPVLDLDDVVYGMNNLNSRFGAMTVSASVYAANGMNNMLTRNQNGIAVNNKDVVRSINSLKNDVMELGAAISRLRVVMDTGTLVGQIADPLDRTLGAKAARNGRWV